MTISVSSIKNYMNANMNLLLSGPAGVGKTTMLRKASDELGWKMKYYSASTLDPYTDLVGIPVPQNETKTVEYYRPKQIDEAEVVFFDELNRADDKTLNTVFEIIQFHSINGERLPNLRLVVAAINPNDGDYAVNDLDPALLDRFDAYLPVEPHIDYAFFRDSFGEDIAKASMGFWNDYEKSRKNRNRNGSNKVAYISPRRLEKIVRAFTIIPKHSTVADTLPPDAVAVSRELYDVLYSAMFPKQAKAQKKQARDEMVAALVNAGANAKKAPWRAKAEKLIKDKSSDPKDVSTVVSLYATLLSENVGVNNLFTTWRFVLERMTPSDIKIMSNRWSYQKRRQFIRARQDSYSKVRLSYEIQ